jgi:hypothetical protein
VLIDVALLRSLPRRELIAGLAEVIKYGIIADRALFARLEAKIGELLAMKSGILTEVVAASLAIKAGVVEKDERESDLRAVLNFGHTVGHTLESMTGYEVFLHGGAVAIGMVRPAPLRRESATRSFERIITSSPRRACRRRHIVRGAIHIWKWTEIGRRQSQVYSLRRHRKNPVSFACAGESGHSCPKEINMLKSETAQTVDGVEAAAPGPLQRGWPPWSGLGRRRAIRALLLKPAALRDGERGSGDRSRAGSRTGQDQREFEPLAAALGELEQAPAPAPELPPSMAKLLLQQGYLLEALEVYRRLFDGASNPDEREEMLKRSSGQNHGRAGRLPEGRGRVRRKRDMRALAHRASEGA